MKRDTTIASRSSKKPVRQPASNGGKSGRTFYMKTKSATGTEYVNAQLMDLKDLIDKYAKIISELDISGPRYVKRNYIDIDTGPLHTLFEHYKVSSGNGPFFAFGVTYHNRGVPEGIGGFICSAKTFQYILISEQGTYLHTASSYTVNGKTVYMAGRNAFQFYFDPSVDAPLNNTDIVPNQEYPRDRQVAYDILVKENQF